MRIFAGLNLLGAAGLKAYQLAIEPVAGTSFLESRWFLIGLVELELLLAVVLLFALWPRTVWFGVLACFALFAGVSIWKALDGQTSCGCFGQVAINPWFTAAIDIFVVLSLVRFRPAVSTTLPHETNFFHESRRVLIASTVWISLGVPATVAMGSYGSSTLSDAGTIVGDGNTVVLEPEKWVGKRFPLLDFIDIGDNLKNGKWLVVLYRRNCPHCMEAMPKYEELIRRSENDSNAVRVAFVELPPYGESGSQFLQGGNDPRRPAVEPAGRERFGRLSQSYRWFVRTPSDVELKDGLVTSQRSDHPDNASQSSILGSFWE